MMGQEAQLPLNFWPQNVPSPFPHFPKVGPRPEAYQEGIAKVRTALKSKFFRVFGLVLVTLVALGVVAFYSTPRFRSLPPPLLLRAAPEAAWMGIEADQRAGIMLLLQDALEVETERTVLTEAPHARIGASRVEVLQISARRDGTALHLQIDRTRPDGGWDQIKAFGLPVEAFRDFLQALGHQPKRLEALLPNEPRSFWELTRVLPPIALPAVAPALNRAKVLVEQEPTCAAAHFALANLMYRQLIMEVATTEDFHLKCEGVFRKALELLPGYPRAAYQMVRWKTDVGAAREALDQAFAFRRQHPRNFLVYGGLAYVARNSGLLDGALEALRARETLCGGILADPGLAENTYLYRGDAERFHRTLAPLPGLPFSPVREFYRGYMCLIEGDAGGARDFFLQARQQPGQDAQFEALAKVYDLALDGQKTEALGYLRTLRADRASLRVPDGEFTFKLAEAFAFLGQRDEAIDTATRAFGQGFGCTRWYRESPLLANLRGLPRWNALLQHLQERQNLMSQTYPAHRFGLE